MGNAPHPVHRPLKAAPKRDCPAFPPVSVLLVGATGFERVTTSVSAKPREPLCYTPFSQVIADRRAEGKRSLGVQLNALFAA
jgi:hypothetical protein